MINARDVEYHLPPDPDHPTWGESNFFSFYVPEENLCGSVYVVVRKTLGIAMAHVTIFDRVDLDRSECVYINGRQHLRAPESLSDYTLDNGLSIKATRAPYDYEVHYEGADGTTLDLDFTALMEPYDAHDQDDPNASAERRAEGEDFAIVAYNGHFDMTGRVRGKVTIGDRTATFDCVDTMDHSWGPRPEVGLPMVSWGHAHFDDETAIHWIATWDPDKRGTEQYEFLRGYAVEGGKVVPLTGATLRAARQGKLGVSMSVDAVGVNGKTWNLRGGVVSATNAAWYASMDINYALHRWSLADGRVGYGCVQESLMLDTLPGRRR